MDEAPFFSLRWKLSILFGIGMLFVYGAYFYYAYNEVNRAFKLEREHIQSKQFDTAQVLSNEAFQTLDQLAEGLALSVGDTDKEKKLSEMLERNGEQLQLIWDIENVTLFDESGRLIGAWGRKLTISDADVHQVLKVEEPVHRLVCPDACFQQTMIPMLGQSKSSGVLSVSQSFADIIIKYKKLTNNDIGILVEDFLTSEDPNYAVKLTAKTFSGLDFDILGILSKSDAVSRFADRNERLSFGDRYYELGMRRMNHSETNRAPFFVFVNDITHEIDVLNVERRSIWIQVLMSFFLSLLVLLIVLRFFIGRVDRLSKAIPLLAGRQFPAFRQQVKSKRLFPFFHDEIDQLNHSVLGLAQQLELVEQIVNTNTLEIIEHNRNLAEERDFINRMVSAAPVIMITQRMNGLIASANQAAADVLGEERDSIIGKLFDLYLPSSEEHHRAQLARLRSDRHAQRLQIEGSLSSKLGGSRDIFWIHAPFYQDGENQEAFVLSMGVDMSVEHIVEQKLLVIANFDPVTGLGNQRSFESELADRLASAKRHGGKLALLVFDVTPRGTGDLRFDISYMVRVASRLKPILRSSDRLYRIGDNRFALIMPNCQQRGIIVLANKIIDEVESLNVEIDSPNLFLSTGIGIALYPQHGDTVDQLRANAHSAMHHAKKDGFYLFFDQQRNSQGNGKRRSEWQVLFDIAFDRDRFVLSYQPVWDIDQRCVSYFKSRLCIRRDDRSLISPKEYWLYAEQLGLAARLERLLVVTAINELAFYNQSGNRISISIGLSGALFLDPDFCSDMAGLLNKNAVDPSQIMFEISESSVIGQFVIAQRFVRRIKEYGCRCALNDIGIEFSSFFYLKHLPVDFVEIDGQFVDQIKKNQDNRNNLQLMVEVAQALDKVTIIESVSTRRIFDVVRKMGVNNVAGDLIGKPSETPIIQTNRVG
ncbi:MAG: EAL domain-containing protein [Gammaproteobacteria bacterium]|nr:EAL domain-containing protein [Gammaproteobacteria bacterium]